MKKLTALLLALVMVLAIGSTALADTNNTWKGSDDGTGLATTNIAGTTTIPLNKTLIFINKNESPVHEPNITYTYAVASQDPGEAKVTDADNDSIKVTAGPTGGVYFDDTTDPTNKASEIIFSSNNTVATKEKGNEIQKSTNMSVDITKFNHAGVYRYKITETASPDVAAVGIERDATDYDNTRYLDVYIGRKVTGGTGTATDPYVYSDTELEMKGAVIYKTVETDDSKKGKDPIDKDFEKTTGFEPGTNGTPGTTDYTNDTTVDRYTTYDFTVKKTVAGSMSDTKNEFPFYVSVTNTIDGAKFDYTADATETFVGATNASGVVTLTAANFTIGETGNSSSLALKHNDFIKLVGVPSNLDAATPLKVTVQENNNTPDEYTLTVEAKNGGALTTNPADGKLAKDATGAMAAAFDVKANDDKEQTITFTNTIAEISPTGVVLRFAPYAIMLGAGVALFIILKVRKNKAVEEA